MSSELKLEAETGRDHGSRSARRLRRSNKIPAVLYGQGSEPLSVTLDRLKFRATLNAAGPNAVITLDVDGTDYLTIVKNMQRAVVQQQMMTLTVEAPAGNIPQQFEVDISEMSIDNPVRVSDITFGSGVVPQAEEDSLIAIGQRSRASIAAEEEEDVEGEESDELGEGAEAGEDAADDADAGENAGDNS